MVCPQPPMARVMSLCLRELRSHTMETDSRTSSSSSSCFTPTQNKSIIFPSLALKMTFLTAENVYCISFLNCGSSGVFAPRRNQF